MQSIAVLLLALCCMASAHRPMGICKMAIRHLEARQNCDLPSDFPQRCIDALLAK